MVPFMPSNPWQVVKSEEVAAVVKMEMCFKTLRILVIISIERGRVKIHSSIHSHTDHDEAYSIYPPPSKEGRAINILK